MAQVRSELREGCWLESLDLQDAYWHVPIHLRYRKFLAFQGEGDISVHQTPFRTLTCPERLHKASEGSRRTLDKSRRLHIHMPKRLVDTCAHQRGCINQRICDAESISRYGVQDRLGQVGIEWDTINASLSLAPDDAHRTLRSGGRTSRTRSLPVKRRACWVASILRPQSFCRAA